MRDSDATKERILDAAVEAFSTIGFAASGVREIGMRAGANPSLVNRYFGSKLGLFSAALDATLRVEPITRLPRDTLAQSLANSFADTASFGNPLPMIVFAAADVEAQAVAQDAIQRRIVGPLGSFIGGADGEARALRVMAIASGFFTYRILYPMPAFRAALSPDDRKWLIDAFQLALRD